MRAFPFFSGIAIGVIIDKLKENKVKFSQVCTLILQKCMYELNIHL